MLAVVGFSCECLVNSAALISKMLISLWLKVLTCSFMVLLSRLGVELVEVDRERFDSEYELILSQTVAKLNR